MGVFEFAPFEQGTKVVAQAIASSQAFSIAGGGDTLAAIAKYGIESDIGYISTGGGASLEFLEGLELPGVTFMEPAYATALDWLLCDAVGRIAHGPATTQTAAPYDDGAYYLRLTTRPLDQAPFEAARARLGDVVLRRQVLAGGYRLVDAFEAHPGLRPPDADASELAQSLGVFTLERLVDHRAEFRADLAQALADVVAVGGGDAPGRERRIPRRRERDALGCDAGGRLQATPDRLGDGSGEDAVVRGDQNRRLPALPQGQCTGVNRRVYIGGLGVPRRISHQPHRRRGIDVHPRHAGGNQRCRPHGRAARHQQPKTNQNSGSLHRGSFRFPLQ